jgi:hypothetical protein
MIDILSAVPTEQVLAREIAALITNQGYDVDHLECRETVFQVSRPSPQMRFNGRS